MTLIIYNKLILSLKKINSWPPKQSKSNFDINKNKKNPKIKIIILINLKLLAINNKIIILKILNKKIKKMIKFKRNFMISQIITLNNKYKLVKDILLHLCIILF